MKANKTLLSTCTGLLLLTGCAAGYNTQVSDPDEALFTVGDESITRNDEYELIKYVNGPDLMMQGVQSLIYEEEIGSGDDVKKEADELLKQYTNGDEKTFLEQLKNYGYSSLDEYKDAVIIPSVQAQMLLDKYIDENRESIEADFHPVLAAVIECDSEDNAQKAIDALKEDKNTEEVGKQYAQEGAAFTGKEEIITTETTTLPTRLLNTLAESDKDGVLDEIFSNDTSTDDKKYYAVKIISRDFDENLDQISEALSSNQELNKDCVIFYLSKYDFEVHDQYIFDYLKALNPEYLVTRPDLSE